MHSTPPSRTTGGKKGQTIANFETIGRPGWVMCDSVKQYVLIRAINVDDVRVNLSEERNLGAAGDQSSYSLAWCQ